MHCDSKSVEKIISTNSDKKCIQPTSIAKSTVELLRHSVLLNINVGALVSDTQLRF